MEVSISTFMRDNRDELEKIFNDQKNIDANPTKFNYNECKKIDNDLRKKLYLNREQDNDLILSKKTGD